jgi:hypothetical protein
MNREKMKGPETLNRYPTEGYPHKIENPEKERGTLQKLLSALSRKAQ